MKKIISPIALLFCCNLLSAQNKNVKDQVQAVDTADLFILNIAPATFLYGGIALVVLLIVGYLVYRFFKDTEEKKADLFPVIKKIYPNPSHGPITIEIQGKASQLKLLNMKGQPLGAFAVIGGSVQFDLSSMPRGNYTVVAYYGATESNAAQFTLQ